VDFAADKRDMKLAAKDDAEGAAHVHAAISLRAKGTYDLAVARTAEYVDHCVVRSLSSHTHTPPPPPFSLFLSLSLADPSNRSNLFPIPGPT
jgi:hypothetical protein